MAPSPPSAAEPAPPPTTSTAPRSVNVEKIGEAVDDAQWNSVQKAARKLLPLGRIATFISGMVYTNNEIPEKEWFEDEYFCKYNSDDFTLTLTDFHGGINQYSLYPNGEIWTRNGTILGTVNSEGNITRIDPQDDVDYRRWVADGGEPGFEQWKTQGKPKDGGVTIRAGANAPNKDTNILRQNKHPVQKKMLDKYEGENNPGHPEWSFFGKDAAVKYLSEEQLPDYEVGIQDGLLVHKGGALAGTPVDTLDAGDAWSGTGKAIFVMDPQGKIYLSKSYPVAEFHHSSFLSGKPVASAGSMIVANGRILEISNDSGHYQPLQSLNTQVIDELVDQGLSKNDAEKIVRIDYDI